MALGLPSCPISGARTSIAAVRDAPRAACLDVRRRLSRRLFERCSGHGGRSSQAGSALAVFVERWHDPFVLRPPSKPTTTPRSRTVDDEGDWHDTDENCRCASGRRRCCDVGIGHWRGRQRGRSPAEVGTGNHPVAMPNAGPSGWSSRRDEGSRESTIRRQHEGHSLYRHLGDTGATHSSRWTVLDVAGVGVPVPQKPYG